MIGDAQTLDDQSLDVRDVDTAFIIIHLSKVLNSHWVQLCILTKLSDVEFDSRLKRIVRR